MDQAREMLLRSGLGEEQIATKIVDGSRSPTDDILKDARINGFGTIVVGRRGISGFKEFVFGNNVGFIN